jgi:hypothetical protein
MRNEMMVEREERRKGRLGFRRRKWRRKSRRGRRERLRRRYTEIDEDRN